MRSKVIFLDRDGVINEEVGYLHKIEDFKFIHGVIDSCKNFLSLGYEIIIITNQSGIARGLYKLEDFHILNNWMLDKLRYEGINILDVFFCPHGPNDDCDCRKPKPGLFLNAKEKYDVDMKNSWMIGDKEDDIKAANSAGISQTILVRSGHKIDEKISDAKYFIDSVDLANEIIKA